MKQSVQQLLQQLPIPKELYKFKLSGRSIDNYTTTPRPEMATALVVQQSEASHVSQSSRLRTL